ncbi:MAG: hypothetical protein ACYC7L_00850 [Nitrospirota bacterium]
MRPLFAALLILFVALPAYAHPGKTDRYGGHKCYKECAEWDLYYAEYHLHDKDGRPVKVVRKRPVRSVPTTTIVEAAAASAEPEPPAAATPPVVRAAIVPDEPGLPLNWILLALFLLLLLVVRRRRKKEEGNDLPSR